MADDIIDFLRVNFAQLNRRMDNTDRRLDELTQRTGAVERITASVKLDIAELGVSVASISFRLDGVGWPARPDRAAGGHGSDAVTGLIAKGGHG